jgi:large subunit ribosomal protein L25
MKQLIAEKRQKVGTPGSSHLRKNQKVPANIYGLGKESLSFSIAEKDLQNEMKEAGFFTRLFSIDVEGHTEKAIAKKIQYHPVNDTPIHVEFQRVDEHSTIRIHVPIRYINEDKCPGIKLGGILNIIHHTLEINCPPHSIPQEFIVDLDGITVNHSIQLDSLNLPEGVEAAHPERDFILASVMGHAANDDGESK